MTVVVKRGLVRVKVQSRRDRDKAVGGSVYLFKRARTAWSARISPVLGSGRRAAGGGRGARRPPGTRTAGRQGEAAEVGRAPQLAVRP